LKNTEQQTVKRKETKPFLDMIFILLIFCVSIGLLYWIIMAYSSIRLSSVPILSLSTSECTSLPSLTVVVPACNEAADIEAAARTILAQEYPTLTIILVDDRSTDITGQIIDKLASEDARVKAIHITELPEGWLGKVHALHTGLKHATGELVLFTDADVHFADGALRTAIDHFCRRNLDQMAGFPRLNQSGIILGAMLTAFLRQFVAVMRPWKVSDPASRAYIGVGAFNLVRKQAFLAGGGFEWLRMEIGDDVGVGLMLKRAGFRCEAVRMMDWLSLYWHRTISQAVLGSEKGWSSVCRFSISKTIILGLFNMVLELAPLWIILLLYPPQRLVGWLGTITFLLYGFSAIINAHLMHQRITPHLLSIFVAPIGFAVIVRTAIMGYYRGGAIWRGTFYATKALKEGMRLKFP
jgi:cellulose synthase/poly-beta-1,6-N-acetylglucosamine synthase-like glycosyltransferase